MNALTKASHAVILTESFPFLGGDDFLVDEMPAWVKEFERVTLVPAHSHPDCFELPEGAAVDLYLCRNDTPLRRVAWLVLGVATSLPCLLRELAPLLLTGRAAAFGPTIKAYARWARAKSGLKRLFRSSRPDIVYSYWMNPEAFAAAALRLSGDWPPVISRAHGIDLYEERWPAGHMPLRDQFIHGIDLMMPISEAGRDHLTAMFPGLSPRVEVHRLGVPVKDALSQATPGGELHVVTIASCVPVKRLDRVPPALEVLHRSKPELQLKWTHIGGGPGWDELFRLTSATLGGKVITSFTGRMQPHEVLDYLRTHDIDLLLNVSESEGIPVALMEGMASGIPSMAPNVGGIPELVIHDRNGWLLPAHPAPEVIAGALLHASSASKDADLRHEARMTIERSYSSVHNYARVAHRAVLLARQG